MAESFVAFERELNLIFSTKSPTSNIAFNYAGDMQDGNHICFPKFGTGQTSGVEGALFCRESELIVNQFRRMANTSLSGTVTNAFVCWTSTFADRPTDFYKLENGRKIPGRTIPCNKSAECATAYVALAVDLDMKLATIPIDNVYEMNNTLMDNFIAPGIIPAPTFINCSGHGLHVVWKLPRKICIPAKSHIGNRNYILYIAALDIMKHLLAPLGADPAVGPTHWLRVPGTINRKESGETMCRNFFINEENSINLEKFVKEYPSLISLTYTQNNQLQLKYLFRPNNISLQASPRQVAFPPGILCHDSYVAFSFDDFSPSEDVTERMMQHGNLALDLAELLVNFRDEPSAGREVHFFYIALHFRFFYGDSPNAEAKTSNAIYKINDSMNYPLTQRELELHSLHSANHYYHLHTRYSEFLWKNEKYINYFCISNYECRKFRYLITNREKSRRAATRYAEKKKKQQEKYWEMKFASNIPSKKEEIARRQSRLAELIKNENTPSIRELADLFDVSTKTIRNDLKKINAEVHHE